MHLLCALSLCLTLFSPDEADIPILKAKPSTVLKSLRGHVPEGLEILADDLKGHLRVRGTESQIEDLKMMVALFDVAPRRISSRFKLTLPADKNFCEGTVNVGNNRPFTFSDSPSGVKVTFTIRINDDGTIITLFVFEMNGGIFNCTRRAKDGNSHLVKLVETTPANEQARAMLKYKDTMLWPEFSITPLIVREDEKIRRKG
jgi:hypothetical protein